VVDNLRPGEEATVSLSVAVFAPGVYDVSKYRVSWSLKALPASEEPTPGADAVRPPGLPPKPKSAATPSKAPPQGPNVAAGGEGKSAGDKGGGGDGQGLGGFEKEGSGTGQPWLLIVRDANNLQSPVASGPQTSTSTSMNLLDL
jgi:hypothetical protein